MEKVAGSGIYIFLLCYILTQPQRTSFSNGSKTQRDHFIPMHHRSNYKTEGNIHGVRLLEPSWTILIRQEASGGIKAVGLIHMEGFSTAVSLECKTRGLRAV